MERLYIGVEVGGTFTDWVVTDGTELVKTGKVLSTPGSPDVGVLNAIEAAGYDIDRYYALVHGSTIATNVVLERKGANTALITTEGFRDVLAIQRQAKQRLFDLFYKHPEPLVPRDRILEASEKMAPDGTPRRPLALDGLVDKVGTLLENGTESIAISLLHSYANPAHEEQIEQAVLDRFPNVFITRSSDIMPQFREYERTSTTVMSAYTKPAVDRYLERLEQNLGEKGFEGQFNVIQANGGTVPAEAIRRHAVRMILSGPAAGVVGATAAATEAGYRDIITLDMGGTSTDVCLVPDGNPKITTDYKIGGLPLQLPMIDIVTVGAGGGSLAGPDEGGILKVGPESAGADPGPACYGRGGERLTVTDANVGLGYIRPKAFHGGKMHLDVPATEQALASLARELSMDDLEAAAGVRRLVNATMAQAIQLVSVERGYDPRDYTIVAYGGGGPLHAAELAAELDIAGVLIPNNPGILSAYGLLIADIQQDYMVTNLMPAESVTGEVLTSVFASLKERAEREFQAFDVDWSKVEIEYFIDLRYMGQAYELSMPADEFASGRVPISELSNYFHDFHRNRYGHASSREGVEAVNFRISARHPSQLQGVTSVDDAGDEPQVEEGTLVVGGERQSCNFLQRGTLPVGYKITGPAVIEEPTATTFVPPDWVAEVDQLRNLHMRRA